jgi:hypothetical protein
MPRRLLSIATLALVAAMLGPHTLLAQPEQLCFPQVPSITDCLSGRFLQFWQQHGGLPIFGYPISPVMDQQTPDGTFSTQYLERNSFESHPDQSPPYDIMLGRLGVERLQQEGRDWFGFTKANPGAPHYFKETGHAIAHGPFWAYWSGHGLEFDGKPGFSEAESLALFGYPISEPAVETNASGDAVLTQWFERARFEDHGARGVMLGLLGTETRAAATTPPPAPPAPTPTPKIDPCAGIPAQVDARVRPTHCIHRGAVVEIDVAGFDKDEDAALWLNSPDGPVVTSSLTVKVDNKGNYTFKWDTSDPVQQVKPGLWYWVVVGKASTHRSVAYIKVLP